MGFLDNPVCTHLLGALDLGGFMRIVGVDNEGEDESAALVHSWEDHTSWSATRRFVVC